MMLSGNDFERIAADLFRFTIAVVLVLIGLGAGLTCIGLYMLCTALAGVFA